MTARPQISKLEITGLDLVAGDLPRFQPHFCGLVLENTRPACRWTEIWSGT